MEEDTLGRLAKLSNEEVNTNGVADNTKRATTTAVKALREYLTSKGKSRDFENFPNSELDETLSKFYLEFRIKNGQLYKKSTIRAYRHGLQRHLEKTRDNVSILNGEEFRKSAKAFVSMTKELKREGKAVVEHHPTISDDDLDVLYSYLASDRNDLQLLQYKVFVDLMLHFGKRGRKDVASLKRQDFAVTTDVKQCMFVFKTTDDKTKTHQDDWDKSRDGRMYEIKENDRCPVRSFIRYIRMLNPENNRLFQVVRPTPKDGVHFYNCGVGHNKLGGFMTEISKSAGLSRIYTNHSLRATTVHILDAAQIPSRHIIRDLSHTTQFSMDNADDEFGENQPRAVASPVESDDDHVIEIDVAGARSNEDLGGVWTDRDGYLGYDVTKDQIRELEDEKDDQESDDVQSMDSTNDHSGYQKIFTMCVSDEDQRISEHVKEEPDDSFQGYEEIFTMCATNEDQRISEDVKEEPDDSASVSSSDGLHGYEAIELGTYVMGEEISEVKQEESEDVPNMDSSEGCLMYEDKGLGMYVIEANQISKDEYEDVNNGPSLGITSVHHDHDGYREHFKMFVNGDDQLSSEGIKMEPDNDPSLGITSVYHDHDGYQENFKMFVNGDDQLSSEGIKMEPDNGLSLGITSVHHDHDGYQENFKMFVNGEEQLSSEDIKIEPDDGPSLNITDANEGRHGYEETQLNVDDTDNEPRKIQKLTKMKQSHQGT